MRITTIFFQRLTIAGILSCFLNGCVVGGTTGSNVVPESRQKENIYYAPSSPNAPLLTEKGDIYGTLHRSSGQGFTSIELQAAYMVGKHFGMIGSYSFGNVKSTSNFTFNKFELGGGYAQPINQNFHFEAYAGFGLGNTNNEHYTGTSIIKNNFFFVQPAIVLSNPKKTVQLAFVTKFVNNNFKVTTDNFDHSREPFSADQLFQLYSKPFHIFWEPGLVFRIGGENVGFHVGYSYSKDLSDDNLYQASDNFSLGVYVKFNTLKKKK